MVTAGLPEHEVVAALSQRFTVAEMTAALAFEQQQGLVNTSGVKRPLMLSKNFAEHMEVTMLMLTCVLLTAITLKQLLASPGVSHSILNVHPSLWWQVAILLKLLTVNIAGNVLPSHTGLNNRSLTRGARQHKLLCCTPHLFQLIASPMLLHLSAGI